MPDLAHNTAEMFINRFPFLSELRYARGISHPRNPFPLYHGYFLAAASVKEQNCCFVLPHHRNSAYQFALLLALTRFKNHFDIDCHDYAAKCLKCGQSFLLRPDGGVYEFAGFDHTRPDRIRLYVAGKGTGTFPVDLALRLEPTKRKTPKGKLSLEYSTSPETCFERLVGVRTWENRSITKNRVILITERRAFQSFAEKAVISIKQTRDNTAISEWLTTGTVEEGGVIAIDDSYLVGSEPMIAISRTPEFVADACIAADSFTKTVIVDGSARMSSSLQAYDDISSCQNLVIISDYNDMESLDILAQRGCGLWYMTTEELLLRVPDQTYNSVDLVHKAAANMQKLKVQSVRCIDDRLERAAEDLSHAGRLVAEAGETLTDLIGQCFGFLCHLAAVLEFDNSRLPELATRLRSTINMQLPWLSPEAATLINDAVTAMEEFCGDNKSSVGTAKASALWDILSAEGASLRKTAVVVGNRASTEYIPGWVTADASKQCKVYTIRDLPAEQYDRLIVLAWLGKDKMAKLMNRYCSPEIVMLLYPYELSWFKQFSHRQRDITRNGVDTQRKAVMTDVSLDFYNITNQSVPSLPDYGSTELYSPLDYDQYIVRRKDSPSQIERRDDGIEARYVGFTGDCYAYITDGHRLPVVTDLISGLSDQVSIKYIEEVRPGDMVVFREHGESDIIRNLAEITMGALQYRSIRTCSSRWKKSFEGHGLQLEDLHKLLARYGLKRELATLRNWLKNPEVIGPGRKSDLSVIAEVFNDVELKAKVDSVWQAICAIRNAHMKAGRQLTELLMESLPGNIATIQEEDIHIETAFGEVRIVEVEMIDVKLENRPSQQTNRLLTEREQGLFEETA